MRTYRLLCFTLLLICSHAALSQGDIAAGRPKKSYWVDLGAGWGGQGSALDVGLSFEIAPKRLISLRFSTALTNDRCTDYAFVFPIADQPLGKDANSYEISYGILKKGKVALTTLSAGLSFVNVQTGRSDDPTTTSAWIIDWSTCPDDYTSSTKNTIGLALRAQWIPSIRWAGLGISPYLNINPEYSFGSLSIQLALGRIKPAN